MNSKKLLASTALFVCGLFALTGCDENFSSSSGGSVATDSSSVEVEDPSLGFEAKMVSLNSAAAYIKVSHNGQEIVCYAHEVAYGSGFSCMSLADSKIILQGDQGELNNQ